MFTEIGAEGMAILGKVVAVASLGVIVAAACAAYDACANRRRARRGKA